MANQNLVPRDNGSGSLGTQTKQWGNGHFVSMSISHATLTGSFEGRFQKITTRVTSSDYTVTTSDQRIAVRYTATGSVEIQLPLVSDATGYEFSFKDEEGNAAINNITISASGSDTIDGASTAVIDSNYFALNIYNDEVNKWFVE